MDAARLASLATWRITQGMYRFDPTIYTSLVTTSLNAKLPAEVLYYLPERGIYVETPGLGDKRDVCHGCFASLEWSHNKRETALLLMLDTDKALQPIVIPLDRENMLAALAGAIGIDRVSKQVIAYIGPILSLLLYLCSTNADMGDFRPLVPKPVKTKKGPRLFPPTQPALIEVGYRLGGMIRGAQDAKERLGHSPTGTTVAPHIRRAHWHTFWLGKADEERRPDVRWMHPVAVNMNESVPDWVTYRRVK